MSRAVPFLAVYAGLMLAATGWTAEQPTYTPESGLALSGYDPIAYFTDGQPVEGRAEFGYQWQGATWQFNSLEHLERFKADPAAFAPAFGGYCAWAVSQGYTASADPRAWRIVDGRLYLNYSLEVQQTWARDVPGNIARGEANWPGVLDR